MTKQHELRKVIVTENDNSTFEGYFHGLSIEYLVAFVERISDGQMLILNPDKIRFVKEVNYYERLNLQKPCSRVKQWFARYTGIKPKTL